MDDENNENYTGIHTAPWEVITFKSGGRGHNFRMSLFVPLLISEHQNCTGVEFAPHHFRLSYILAIAH